jgi:hypothetical protein
MSCSTKNEPGVATSKLPADACARLALFEEAAFQIASGNKKVEVRHGEFFVRYANGASGLPFLTREISRLRAICGNRQAITIGRTNGTFI